MTRDDRGSGFGDPARAQDDYLSLQADLEGVSADGDGPGPGRGRFARVRRVMDGLSRHTPRLRVGVMAVVGLVGLSLCVGAVAWQSHESRALSEARADCGAVKRSLSDALTARSVASRRVRADLDLTLLKRADPELYGRVDGLLAAPKPVFRDCAADPVDAASRMRADEQRIRDGTGRLKRLAGQARSRSAAYASAEAADRFDRALASARALADGLDDGQVKVPLLLDRLREEIDRARDMPRDATADELDRQSDVLESLTGQVRDSLKPGVTPDGTTGGELDSDGADGVGKE